MPDHPNTHTSMLSPLVPRVFTNTHRQRESRLPILCAGTSSSSVNMYVLHVTTRVRLAGWWPACPSALFHNPVPCARLCVCVCLCATAAASGKRCCLGCRSTRTEAAAAMRIASATHARVCGVIKRLFIRCLVLITHMDVTVETVETRARSACECVLNQHT